MNYLSLAFAVFVMGVLAVYYLTPQKFRWVILLCASISFYLFFDVRYILFLLIVAVSTFFGAKFGRNKTRNKENLVLCLIFCVGLWFLIKVMPWVESMGNAILGKISSGMNITIPALLVPIGISYYVLMAISYVVDVYKKRIEPEKNFLKYLLYLSYFPAIVQGPISRYGQLREQFTIGKKISYDVFRRSVLLILFGVTKKMVVADRIAIWANYCFDNYMELEGLILYIGALSYSIQLYMDFSGCVDICRGVSSLFGIHLVDNFNAPYFSKSIKEFWGKWHISLSTWLKDYVYIPLGGNRKGKIRKYVNLLVTFLVSGIWHGSGLNYIVWGCLHAIYQIVGDCTSDFRRRVKCFLKIKENSFSDQFYKLVITFNLTLFAWIFFRAGRLLNAVEYIARMFGAVGLWGITDGTLFDHGILFPEFIIMLFNLFIFTIADWRKTKSIKNIEDSILDSHVIIRWGCYVVLIFNILFFGVYGSGYDAAGFLYGGY